MDTDFSKADPSMLLTDPPSPAEANVIRQADTLCMEAIEDAIEVARSHRLEDGVTPSCTDPMRPLGVVVRAYSSTGVWSQHVIPPGVAYACVLAVLANDDRVDSLFPIAFDESVRVPKEPDDLGLLQQEYVEARRDALQDLGPSATPRYRVIKPTARQRLRAWLSARGRAGS